MNYYNEIDPFAAQWLRNLITAGLIPEGKVDERSIVGVRPGDLEGFTQCHFFAGIGGWPLALRLAGWPDDREIWTGSCPCQPFSCAGRGMAEADERHLWPYFRNLIGHRKPAIILGEQVASSLGREWLSGVRSQMAQLAYAFGASDLCAAGVQAPHIRQRLYWMANRQHAIGRAEHKVNGFAHGRNGSGRCGVDGRLGDSLSAGLARRSRQSGDDGTQLQAVERKGGDAGGLAESEYSERGPQCVHRVDGCDGENTGRQEAHGEPGTCGEVCGVVLPNGAGPQPGHSPTETPGHGNPAQPAGFWSDSRWHYCRDGKYRRVPVEPALFPLAASVSARRGEVLSRLGELGVDADFAKRIVALASKYRVGALRGSGNAIVPVLAAQFIKAVMAISQ